MRNCKPVCVCCGHELIVTNQVEKKFHLCLQYCLRGSAFERPFHRQYRCTTRVSDIQIKKYSRFFWARAAVETTKRTRAIHSQRRAIEAGNRNRLSLSPVLPA